MKRYESPSIVLVDGFSSCNIITTSIFFDTPHTDSNVSYGDGMSEY